MTDHSWGGLAVTVHDAAAAVVGADGVVRAVAEERFGGPKRRGGWPQRAVKSLVADNPRPARWGVAWRPWAGLASRVRHGGPAVRAPRAGLLFQQLTAPVRLGAGVRWMPHHLCHAATAFWSSPHDTGAILVVDAAGEGWSSWAGVGEGWGLRCLARTPYPHSLGFLYAGLCEHLGFLPDREEGTVMALAALGSPTEELQEAVASLAWIEGLEVRLDLEAFAHHRRGRPILSREGARRVGVGREPGAPIGSRHADVAAALQRHTERLLVELATALRRATGQGALCLAGGVALNAPAVERVRESSGFEAVFVPPCPHDAGTAVGAALLLAASEGGVDRGGLRQSLAYPGPVVSLERARETLAAVGIPWVEPDDLEASLAAELAQGRIVARVWGRAELGPRALGHRSLLCDPRATEHRDRLNRMKGRESFRPVAPVMTRRAAGRYLEVMHAAPFMERAVRVSPAGREEIPAVVHVDGTARAQIVESGDGSGLNGLLERFGAVTGVEVLGNTSFNGPGEPMVTGGVSAVETARRLCVDVLDLNGCVVDLAKIQA